MKPTISLGMMVTLLAIVVYAIVTLRSDPRHPVLAPFTSPPAEPASPSRAIRVVGLESGGEAESFTVDLLIELRVDDGDQDLYDILLRDPGETEGRHILNMRGGERVAAGLETGSYAVELYASDDPSELLDSAPLLLVVGDNPSRVTLDARE